MVTGPDPQPLGRAGVTRLWLFGSILALGLFVADLMAVRGGLLPQSGAAWGRDFINVWTGGQLVWSGDLDILYDYDAYLERIHALTGVAGDHNYSYPPQSLLLGAVLGLLPYWVAYGVWLVGTATLFWWAARPFVRGFPPVLVVLTPAATMNLWAGQYGFLAGAFWLLCLRLSDRNAKAAGLAAGLLAVKPHLGVVLPALLLIGRRWSTLLWGAAALATIFAASLIAFGPDVWRAYFHLVPNTQASIVNATGDYLYFKMMPTSLIAFRGWPVAIGLIAQGMTAILALWMLWQARGVGFRDLGFAAATATFLILPYAFNYDMTVVCLGLALLVVNRWSMLAGWEKILLIAGFALPQLVVVLQSAHLPAAPLILLACLHVQLRQARAGSLWP